LTTETFSRAVAYDPDLELNPRARAEKLAAPSVVRDGEDLARAGHIISATETFSRAVAYDPDLELDPRARANQLYAETVVEEGEDLARAGHIISATETFSRAVAYDPDLELDPRARAEKLAAPSVVRDGEDLARAGHIISATETFSRAVAYDPDLELDPSTYARETFEQAPQKLMRESETLAWMGKVREATWYLTETQRISPTFQIPARTWGNVCGFGSVWGAADVVLFACERAVALDPDNAALRGNRGMALAQLGDYAGAAADLRTYLAWLQQQEDSYRKQEGIPILEGWIATLEAGQNPFDAETLKDIRAQLQMRQWEGE
jgi:tetratricopeptide (TPR) repeat protein